MIMIQVVDLKTIGSSRYSVWDIVVVAASFHLSTFVKVVKQAGCRAAYFPFFQIG
jgi:hypothetical protein